MTETKQKEVQKVEDKEVKEEDPGEVYPYELEVTPEESEIIESMEECW